MKAYKKTKKPDDTPKKVQSVQNDEISIMGEDDQGKNSEKQ